MRRKQSTITLLIILTLVLISMGIVLSYGPDAGSAIDRLYQAVGLSGTPAPIDARLSVHFIDVGQGDSILIQTAGQNVLIDAGDPDHAETVVDYLFSQGVKRIDLLAATHPHADHIGGMADVLRKFPVDKVLFSEVPGEILPTTRTYEILLDTIADKGLRITRAKTGMQYALGEGAVLTLLGPVEHDREELNDTSLVFRLDYGETTFLFTGDAEKESENSLLEVYDAGELRADVLKLGHHGSSTSSQAKFLRAVNPSAAVASCGYENSYGHPHAEILRRLDSFGIMLYRTDRDGTVVFCSDGVSLEVLTEK